MKELGEMDDAQLSEVFAVEVAGWDKITGHAISMYPDCWITERGTYAKIDECRFAASADQILPWLEKCGLPPPHPWIPRALIDFLPLSQRPNGTGWLVDCGDKAVSGRQPTFARAAAIALITAHRTTPHPPKGETNEQFKEI